MVFHLGREQRKDLRGALLVIVVKFKELCYDCFIIAEKLRALFAAEKFMKVVHFSFTGKNRGC